MINRRALLSSLALLPTLLPRTAIAQQTDVGGRSFSFAVYGDFTVDDVPPVQV